MENILHIYGLAPNAEQPLVCFDEKTYQIIDDIIAPIPMSPGRVKRYSDKYERKGTVQILVAYLPNFGKRFVWVSPKKRATDFAFFIKELMHEYLPTILPKAKKITMVSDNLNTHEPASFYKTFDAQTAFDLSQQIQFHHTPVNGSWLNMAEIEIHSLSIQCLNRRMLDMKSVSLEVDQLVKQRNENEITTNWQFSVNKARCKLVRHYPIN